MNHEQSQQDGLVEKSVLNKDIQYIHDHSYRLSLLVYYRLAQFTMCTCYTDTALLNLRDQD